YLSGCTLLPYTTLFRSLEILQMLKNAGFPFIQLQSNITLRGLNLSVEDLVNAGVNGFGISLHGSTQSTHEKFTCESGIYTCIYRSEEHTSELQSRFDLV